MKINHIIFVIVFFYSSILLAKNQELVIEQKEVNRFIEMIKIIKKNYVYELDDTKIVTDAIKGILLKLDPHSTYYTKSEYFDILNETNGEYGGIGVEVSIVKNNLKIINLYEESPAAKSGLKIGDIITKIDNKKITGMDLDNIKNLIRGEVGSGLLMTIYRPDSKKSIELELERKILKIVNIETKYLANNILYLKINSFSDLTYENIKVAISDYQENNNKLNGLILDFRDNSGGLLEQAIKISDAFLEAGGIVSIKYRDQSDIRKYNASGNNIISKKVKLVILINNNSASASEIFAGAMKDNKRAIIVGNKSFGKGSVQNIIPLKDGDAIKITSALFYTPNGLMIQNNGIEPDIEINNIAYSKQIDNSIVDENDFDSKLNNDEQTIVDITSDKIADDFQLYIANQIINIR